MEALTPWHLALILLGFILLFGYKKLPDATRSLGRSLRIFRSEMSALSEPEPETGLPAGGAAASVDQPGLTTAAVLEQQAREAEAEAMELRARAEAAQGGAARP